MQNYTMNLIRGDDQDVGLVVTNPNDGTPFNLSGAQITFRALCDETRFGRVILTKLATGIGSVLVTGGAYLSFYSGDTANLDDGPFYSDIKLFSIDQKVTTLGNGPMTLYPQ